jgi:ribonuclease P protein component
MLPKSNRLPKSQFQSVFRTGKKMHTDDLMCVVLKTKEVVSQFAFVVSTKVSKHAVDRNRMKRLLRESIHHLLPTIQPGYDIVFVAQKNFADKKESDIEDQVNKILSAIID